MFVPFLIFTGIILTAGPCHLEKGCESIQKNGLKATLEKAVENRKLPRKTYND